MNKNQLSHIIAARTGLDKKTSTRSIDVFENAIKEALSQKQKVCISDFGTFHIFKTKSRAIPNPRNPRQKLITLGNFVTKFKPSEELKRKVKDLIDHKIKSKKPTEVEKIVLPESTEQEKPNQIQPIKIQPEDKAIDKTINIETKPVDASFIELKDKKIPKEILAKIPEHIARSYQIVPVEEKENKLVVAMVNPEDLEAIEFVKKKAGMPLIIKLTSSSELESVLDQYSGLPQEVEEVIEEATKETEEEKPKEKEKKAKFEINIQAPTAKLINSLLLRAVKERASDIHIEPEEKELKVRFRIDGVLQNVLTLPKEMHASIVARIKILANLKTDETRLPQDGRFSIVAGKNEIDFRVSTLPIVSGEKVVMRVLDKSKGILTLEELGLVGRSYQLLEENIHKSHGMILVTGPTGCGKTTSLYAMIDKIYDVGINIVTLEDPVEYQIPGVNQSQINPNIKYSFANGLRSIVRQDPDVIMLGEIRDTETASMAIHAALTGHVLLSTLHTNDASGAIPRFIDMKVEPFLIASSLNLVVAQRLCRKICEDCKTTQVLPSETQSDILKEIKNMPQSLQKDFKNKELHFYKGKGCNVCNQSGYKGRIGIFEVLPVTESIKDLIIKRAPSTLISQVAIKEGMTTLKQDGIKKVADGTTTIEEVLRVTKE
ncbi:MAG: ATPase, T2SS/T4P/T4SS family [Candidatus Berkelbacteria bacterium]|nr:ATPase, T2SS/T4P/T4SS family [Candidatus Berkelbacteria bacterium]